MMRITRDKYDGKITVETDDGNASDHADAHKHAYHVGEYMKEHDMDSVEGDDYHDIKMVFWRKDHDKSGSSNALFDLTW